MNTIEIDFDVFKEITIRRTSEEITPNDVLREIFGLGKAGNSARATPTQNNNEKPWTTKGVSFPHGTPFRAIYKGQTYTATVDNGSLVLNGRKYSSPSSAAFPITKNAVNGWVFWECKMPGSQTWSLIKRHRKN